MFPILTTERLLMRRFNDADLENVFKGLSHPEITRYYGVSFDSLEATREQMAWFADLESSGSGIWWAICSPKDDEFYGAGGFNNLSREHGKAEVGFWLLPENWGKGFMQEAMPAIIRAGFEQLGLHRIEGFVESDNTNCKKAVARLQFEHEGTMRDCEMKNGRRISIDIYAKLGCR